MPITSNVTYKITCDGCGYEWDSSFGDTYDNLIKYVLNNGAVITEEGEVFCVSCAPGWTRGERPADAYPNSAIRDLRKEVMKFQQEAVEWEALYRASVESAESATRDAMQTAAAYIRAEASGRCDCMCEGGEHEDWCFAVYLEELASRVQTLEAERDER